MYIDITKTAEVNADKMRAMFDANDIHSTEYKYLQKELAWALLAALEFERKHGDKA